MKKRNEKAMGLDGVNVRNWDGSAQPVAVLNEMSTLHERVAFCWGLSRQLYDLTTIFGEASEPDSEAARLSNLLAQQLRPLVAMLDRLGLDTSGLGDEGRAAA